MIIILVIMNEITNTALFEIFIACKKSHFDQEPDFDKVLKQVCTKFDVTSSDQLMADLKSAFVDYKKIKAKINL